jgi:hypothetical protein
MPSRQAFLRRVDADPDLADRYARARRDGLDVIADEMLTLADQCREGVKIKIKAGVEEHEISDMVERCRLQIDTRKWLLSRLRPDKYGDRVQVAGDAEQPLQTRVVIEMVSCTKHLPPGGLTQDAPTKHLPPGGLTQDAPIPPTPFPCKEDLRLPPG